MKLSWLMPKERKFIELLTMVADGVLKGAKALHELTNNYTDLEIKNNNVTEIEHQVDDLVYRIIRGLNESPITPIDGEDIHGLALALDSVLDNIQIAVSRLYSYKIASSDKTMIKFSATLLQACNELNLAVKEVETLKNLEKIEERCIEVRRLENVGDDILNYGVTQLFETKEPLDIIKLKEIYESMENAIDRCEDAADVISDIVIKNR